MRYLQYAKNLPEAITSKIKLAREAKIAYMRGDCSQDDYLASFSSMLTAIKRYNKTAKHKLPIPNYLRFC